MNTAFGGHEEMARRTLRWPCYCFDFPGEGGGVSESLEVGVERERDSAQASEPPDPGLPCNH